MTYKLLDRIQYNAEGRDLYVAKSVTEESSGYVDKGMNGEI